MNTALLLANEAAFVLAEEPAKGPEFGKASPVGLLVIVVLLVATFLLIRSMNKQLRKLPDSFDSANPEPDQAFDEGTDTIDDDAPVEDGSAEDDRTDSAASASATSARKGDRPDEPGNGS